MATRASTGELILSPEEQGILKEVNRLTIARGWNEWQILWRDKEFNYQMFNEYIWRHSFAQAMWGSKRVFQSTGEPIGDDDDMTVAENTMFAWQWHLQKMVLAPNPIIYLGDHMPADAKYLKIKSRHGL